jgi:hypothetical protein
VGDNEITMLAELFMLRIEAITRSINALGANNSDTRFVPVKPPMPFAKNSFTPVTKNDRLL